MTTVKRRSYHSKIRRGDAPGLVCAAARELFSTRGYLATTIDDIAAAAGVARPTVFNAVGSKPAVLKAVIDRAMAGDDAPVTVADRSWYLEAINEPDPERAITLHARNIAMIVGRVAALLRALETAAAVDTDAATLWAQTKRQRREGTAAIAADIASKTALRREEKELADLLFTLPPDAYYRLVTEEGWSAQRFETWLADLLHRTFVA
ncbi:helix-turn-helix domain-containing protein [Intrasporangium sp. YIM S08009]|uniref:TetR/AcrR family transcriptional regulator n=1 Tax=Intrasporangium zincisolvens TaxID=3080018 RepID=UPI002B05B4DD|nr:helix-turn-helix domain-containing protein [Intrasporangium sp. YIM S08009]